MASPRPIRIRLLALICAAVCLVSMSLGWFLGTLGIYLYTDDLVFLVSQEVGGWLGLCSGLLAGIVWCWVTVPLSLRQVAGLRSMGGLTGLGAGVLAAVVLHGGMMTAASEIRVKALAVGLGMAAPAGLVLGVIGAHLCRLAVTTQRVYRPATQNRRLMPFDRPLPAPDPMEQLDVHSCWRPHPDFRDEYDA